MTPDDPTMPSWSVGVITGGCTKEHVKRVKAKSSALDDPTSTEALCQSNDVSSQPKMPSAPDDPKEHRSNARSNDVSRVLKIPSVPDDPTRTG